MRFTFRLNDDSEIGLLEEKHAVELFELTDRNRDYLREWLPWLDATKTSEDTRQFIKRSLEQFTRQGNFSLSIWFKGKLAGTIGYSKMDSANQKVSIGYWIGSEYQHKGLVTLASTAMIDYAFNDLGLNRLEILCAVNNKQSQAIPERLGFTQEGILRQAEKLYDQFVDLVVYGILTSEWRNNIKRSS
jgi:ribosomal-protein-serine acetyltransferase